MPIQLTEHEEQMLRSVLEMYLPSLRIERANTDDREYRTYLKDREAFIGEFLSRLG